MSVVSPHPGLALFEVPPVVAGPDAGYTVPLDNAAHAESLGFETYWVAEGRFSNIGLPSSLAFLAALSQRTTTLRLGTAVVPLAFDNPLRLAETASVVNALSGDRLELGVGKGNGRGFSSAAYNVFGLDETRRDELYREALDHLRDAFSVQHVTEDRTFPFHPPAGALPERIWQATSRTDSAAAIGRSGDALQLHRFAQGGRTGDVQKDLIDVYLDEFTGGRAPRIGVSRTVLPAESKAQAVRLFTANVERVPSAFPWFTAGTAIEDALGDFHILHGTPEEIASELAQDAAASAATDYLFNIPLPLDDPHYRASLPVIANEIYPAFTNARRSVGIS